MWALARHLGVPDVIVGKPPSADLIVGQTDEGDFGISYAKADTILNWLLSGYTAADLVARGFDAGDVDVVRAPAREHALEAAAADGRDAQPDRDRGVLPAAGGLLSRWRGGLRPPLDGVADVQQDLKIELFAPVREVECRHLRVITRCLRALERFGVHLIEIGQDTITRPGHTQRLDSSKGQAGGIGRRLLRGGRGGDEQPLGRLPQKQARTDRIRHDEL